MKILRRFHAWRTNKVRSFSWGPPPLYPYHVTLTPRPAFSLPWKGEGRIRWSPVHGLQIVEWNGAVWQVTRQLFGRSNVIAEPRKE